MNRIISLSVEDMYIKYTGEAFGATGSHNAVTLQMTFGPAWEGTAKTAYFTDALGNTSVALVLGLDTLVDGAYEVDVPSEALKTAGVATITIKGVLVSGETTTKAITTAAGHFRVLDSELPDSAGNAGTITPSDKEQLQAEIAGMETLFTMAKAATETAAANAKVSETNAKGSETAAASSASSAEASKMAAAESAATATAKASAAGESAAKAAASQTAAKSSEDAAKASETAAKAAQTGAETAESNAQNSAAAAAGSAQTAQSAASTATNAASFADQAAASASGSASQASAAATAAADSAAGAETANKTAQSWAVGGTGTRPGEDMDNAKYWAQQAKAVAGGDFATKVEAQGYVAAHNQSAEAHADIRNDLNGKEASGTAAAAVTAHNKDTFAHADIREALDGKEAAGAAAVVQSNLTAHAGNTTVHVTSEEKTAWNGKAEGTHASQHGKDGTDPITPTAIGAVGYGAAQSLTDDQKTQARGNIGAAPDGFGVGANGYPYSYTVVTGDTVNSLNRSGLYWFNDTTNPFYADAWNSGTTGLLLHLQSDGHNALSARQIFFPHYPVSGVGRNCRIEREKTGDGTWLPVEFVNPPLDLGMEYRTTERYLGKPVYVKKVNFGNAPAGSIKQVDCATNVATVVDFRLTVWNGAYGQENIIINDDGTLVARPYSRLSEGTLSIALAVFTDISTRTVDLVVKYTKTTD